jgi:hypothetical protein
MFVEATARNAGLGGASLAIALAGAGRFSVDAAIGVTRRLWLRVSPEA